MTGSPRAFAVGNMMKIFAITLFVMATALVASFILTNAASSAACPAVSLPLLPHQALQNLAALHREPPRGHSGTIYTVPMLFAYFMAFCFAAKAFTTSHFWDMTSIMPL